MAFKSNSQDDAEVQTFNFNSKSAFELKFLYTVQKINK